MGADKRVVRHSRLTIVPGRPTPAGKVHPLSLLDHMMQLHFVHNVYYFKTSSANNRATLRDELKESLGKALNIYPVLAGRLRKRDDGKWEIKCNDSGIRIYEANADLTFDEWLESGNCPVESELSMTETIPDHTISPVAVVQFTDFTCGGLTIGLSWLHLLGDPSFGTLFMKAWGECHRAAQVMHPPFYHPPSMKARPKMNTGTKSVAYYASTFGSSCAENGNDQLSKDEYATITFKFSDENVRKIISEVKGGESGYGPTSPFEALAGLFWVSIVKAQGKASTDATKLTICLEFRKIQIPSLPYGYVGNAFHFLGITSSAEDLASKDLSYASNKIYENVGLTDTEDIRSVIDWLHVQDEQGVGLGSKPVLLYGPELTCGAWDEFFSYDVVFDVGKPVHVAYRVQPIHGEGLMLVIPAAEGNFSRNVMVTLPKEQVRRLCEDELLLSFQPQFKNYSLA